MIVKRYYVATMAEAMSTIRAELGPDAVILSSKPVRKKGLMGFFQKKDIEVIAAYEPRLESPKTREQRESEAYAAAIKAARQKQELEPKPAPAIPPAPGAALGPSEPPASRTVVTAAGRAVDAYRNAAVTTASQPGSAHPRAEEDPADALARDAALSDTDAIQEALAAALAARKAAQREGEARPVPPPAPARSEAARREAEHFVPLSPPEMVITPPGTAEAEGQTELFPSPAEPAPVPERDDAPPAPSGSLSDARLDALEQRLSAIADVIGAVAERMGDGEMPLNDDAAKVYAALAENDVEDKLARALAKEAQDLAPRIGGTAREAALRLLLREMRESAPLDFEEGKRSVLVFMGPTGVGKTTTLVKLATMCAVRGGLKVGMINTDTYRIAAQEQLRIYADILAVPQSVVYAPGEMDATLEDMADRDVIFVDTAGKRPGDPQHREDMATLLASLGGEARVLLCVAAPTGSRALREVIDHYSFLPDYGLILTKTDEVAGIGSAINACAFSGRNLHYLTSGQSVPDDIEEVDARAIAERLLG